MKGILVPRSRPPRRRSVALGLAGVLVAALGAAACSSGHGGSDPFADKVAAGGGAGVTLRAGDQAGTGDKALLTAAGLLSGLAYRISWSEYTSGPPLLEAVNAGAVDVGGVGDTPPVFAASAHARIVAVAAYQTRTTGNYIVAPAASTIASVADLRGKRIAVAQGSSANYHLLHALTAAGLGWSDIHVSYLQPADALSALTAGKIDAWDVWEPYRSEAVLGHGAKVTSDGLGPGHNLSFEVASPGSLADAAKQAAIKDYVARIGRARVWAASHLSEWAAAWAKITNLPLEQSAAAAANTASAPTPIDAAVVDHEQAVADAFAKQRLIPADVRISSYLDPRFNAQQQAIASSSATP